MPRSVTERRVRPYRHLWERLCRLAARQRQVREAHCQHTPTAKVIDQQYLDTLIEIRTIQGAGRCPRA